MDCNKREPEGRAEQAGRLSTPEAKALWDLSAKRETNEGYTTIAKRERATVKAQLRANYLASAWLPALPCVPDQSDPKQESGFD